MLSQHPQDGFEPPDTVERRIWGATGSILVVPLVTKGKVIGTVTALNQLEQRMFTQHDVNLLMSLAAQAQRPSKAHTCTRLNKNAAMWQRSWSRLAAS